MATSSATTVVSSEGSGVTFRDVVALVETAVKVAIAEESALPLEALAGGTAAAVGAGAGGSGGSVWAAKTAPEVGAFLVAAWSVTLGASSDRGPPEMWNVETLNGLGAALERIPRSEEEAAGAEICRRAAAGTSSHVPDDTSLVSVWLRLLFSGSAFDLHGDVRLKCNTHNCDCLLYRHNAANRCAQCDHSFTEHTFGILSISRVLESISDLVAQHKDLFWGLMINQCTAFDGNLSALEAAAAAAPGPPADAPAPPADPASRKRPRDDDDDDNNDAPPAKR